MVAIADVAAISCGSIEIRCDLLFFRFSIAVGAVVIAKQYHDEFFLSEQLGPKQPTFQVMCPEGAGP